MAHAATHARSGNSILAQIGQVFVSVFDALVAIGEANPKVRQAEALMALSDDELKSRGLKRYEIANYVFSDSFFA